MSRFSVDWMTIDEGMRCAYELERQMGNDLEVFHPRSRRSETRASPKFSGTACASCSALEFPYYNTTRKGFEVKELL